MDNLTPFHEYPGATAGILPVWQFTLASIALFRTVSGVLYKLTGNGIATMVFINPCRTATEERP